MATILDRNLNIVSGLINGLSTIINNKYLTVINPSGTGTFNFNGDSNISGTITTNTIYCTNNNIEQNLSTLIDLTNNLSGASQ